MDAEEIEKHEEQHEIEKHEEQHEIEKPERTVSENDAYWYFGGIAAMIAALCLHPMELIRVNVQKSQLPVHIMIRNIFRTKGIFGFYGAISASICRQLSYSVPRFAVYTYGYEHMNTSTLWDKFKLATIAGIASGVPSSAFELVSSRMMYDVVLNEEAKWKYKNALHGVYSVLKKGGVGSVFVGAHLNVLRGIFINMGQIAVYDHALEQLLKHRAESCDKFKISVASSVIAASCATLVIHPIDVIRFHQNTAEDSPSLIEVLRRRYHMGLRYFFTGIFYTHIRLVPQTIITFLVLDELRARYGKPSKKNPKMDAVEKTD